jgi:hypothetical protein
MTRTSAFLMGVYNIYNVSYKLQGGHRLSRLWQNLLDVQDCTGGAATEPWKEGCGGRAIHFTRYGHEGKPDGSCQSQNRTTHCDPLLL